MATIQKFLKDNKNLEFELIKGKLLNLNLTVKDLDNLFIINYNSKPEANNIDKEIIKDCRSIIIDKNNYNIIMLGLTGSIEYNEFKELVNWNDVVIEESIDGTLINLYYYNDMWNFSTKKTINGECYWNTEKSFKELFLETIKKYNFNFNILNQKYCYSFVLCHPEARNITFYDKSKLYHVSTRNLETLDEIDEDIGILKPNILKINEYNILNNNCNNYDKLLENLNNLEYSNEGYMLFSKDRKFRTKLKSKNHLIIKELKGIYSNMTLRILELRIENNKFNMFMDLFPEYIELIKNIEKNIDLLAKNILNYYIKTKINKEHIDIPQILKKPIYELHGIYINNKNNIEYNKTENNINLIKITKWLNNLDAKYLCYLLNNCKKIGIVE